MFIVCVECFQFHQGNEILGLVYSHSFRVYNKNLNGEMYFHVYLLLHWTKNCFSSKVSNPDSWGLFFLRDDFEKVFTIIPPQLVSVLALTNFGLDLLLSKLTHSPCQNTQPSDISDPSVANTPHLFSTPS